MIDQFKLRRQTILTCVIVSALLSTLCLGLAGCRSTPSTKVSDIALNYTNYHKITAQPVFVSPELAMLCNGASVGQVEKVREKHGLMRTRPS